MRLTLIALLCVPAVAGAQVLRWQPTVTLERSRPPEPEVAPVPREVPPPPTVTLERESAMSLYRKKVLDRYALPPTVYDVLGRHGLYPTFVPVAEPPKVATKVESPAPKAAPVVPKTSYPDLPEGAVRYKTAKHTQAIAVTNGRDTIDPVLIKDLPDPHLWHQSGGMYGVRGWRSEKYVALPPGKMPEEKFERLRNWNGTSYQRNTGLWVWFPVGTVFVDRLINEETGEVFEDRRREKVRIDDRDTRLGWNSYVYDSNPSARPKGYTGLTRTCQSCHNQAGLGLYAKGGAPGSDTVFSYPLPWHLVDRPGGPVQTANLFLIR